MWVLFWGKPWAIQVSVPGFNWLLTCWLFLGAVAGVCVDVLQQQATCQRSNLFPCWVTLHSISRLEFLWPRPISDAIPVPLPDAPRNLQLREFARSNIEVASERARERERDMEKPRRKEVINSEENYTLMSWQASNSTMDLKWSEHNNELESKAHDFQHPLWPHTTPQFPAIVQAILADENIEDNCLIRASS